jgi:uncharacterized protein (TIGR04222 family)
MRAAEPWEVSAVQLTVAYAAVIVGVLLYVGAVRRGLARPADQPSIRRFDIYDTAYLSGGPARVAQVAAVRLAISEWFTVDGRGEVAVVAPTAAEHAAEEAFLAHLQRHSDVRHALALTTRDPRVLAIGAELASDGYLVPSSRLRALAPPTFAVAAVFAIGGVRLISLAESGRVAWWLFAELGLLVIFAGVLLLRPPRRTSAGESALRELSWDWPKYYDPHADAPVADESRSQWIISVALLGSDALRGTDLDQRLFQTRPGTAGGARPASSQRPIAINCPTGGGAGYGVH